MLIEFFYALKKSKIPVSINEFLTLLEALKQNVISPSIDEFYYLARMILVKDERFYDRFDHVFGSYFNGIESIIDLNPDIPLEWLEEKLKRDEIKNKVQANQTHYEVGKKVRETIHELGGTMPEDLPTVEDIQKLERKAKYSERKLTTKTPLSKKIKV